MYNLDFSIEYLFIDGNISSLKNLIVKLAFNCFLVLQSQSSQFLLS